MHCLFSSESLCVCGYTLVCAVFRYLHMW
jgi:hypothetical protein